MSKAAMTVSGDSLPVSSSLAVSEGLPWRRVLAELGVEPDCRLAAREQESIYVQAQLRRNGGEEGRSCRWVGILLENTEAYHLEGGWQEFKFVRDYPNLR